jgi:hypothetical protein
LHSRQLGTFIYKISNTLSLKINNAGRNQNVWLFVFDAPPPSTACFLEGVQFIQVTLDILFPDTAVSAGGDTQGVYSPLVTPASHGAGVKVQKFRCLFYSQQIVDHLLIDHIFVFLLANIPYL